MANLLERVEELHRRVTELDAACRGGVAIEAHRDLEARVTELEQRVPKPIPVVEPLAERVIREAHEACGESPVFVEPPAEPIPLPVMNDDGLNEQSLRALADGPFGPAVVQHWKERAERAESLVAEARQRILDLLCTDQSSIGGLKARDRARVFIDLARARVAKAVP